MNAVPFDTLKLARRLEAAGFAPPMAAGTAEALAEAMSGAELATKADVVRTEGNLRTDIASVRTELKTDVADLRSGLKSEITDLRSELKSEIGDVRTELRSETASLRSAIEVFRRDMTIRLGGMIIAGFAVTSAILRMMPLHP
jgi:hypothetical protein